MRTISRSAVASADQWLNWRAGRAAASNRRGTRCFLPTASVNVTAELGGLQCPAGVVCEECRAAGRRDRLPSEGLQVFRQIWRRPLRHISSRYFCEIALLNEFRALNSCRSQYAFSAAGDEMPYEICPEPGCVATDENAKLCCRHYAYLVPYSPCVASCLR